MATERVEYEFLTNLDEVTDDGERAERSMKDLEGATTAAGVSALAASEKWQAMGDAFGRTASSTAQVRGGLEDLGIATEGVSRGLQKMTGVADLAEAPLLHITDSMRVMETAGFRAAMAMGAAATATMGVGAALAAITAETEKEKQIFSALTGITWGLTAAQTALAISKSGVATLGFGSALTGAAILTAIGGAIAGLATYAVASYQTEYGQEREVPTTQLAVVHRGERMIREVGGGGGSGITVNIYGQPDYNTMKHLDRVLQRSVRKSGMGGP